MGIIVVPDSIHQKIENVLDTIRPNIQMDGGDVELVNYEDGIVYVRMTGACVGCPASIFTLKMGIEQALKEQIPDVLEVIPVN